MDENLYHLELHVLPNVYDPFPTFPIVVPSFSAFNSKSETFPLVLEYLLNQFPS
jgi:hypothetical protein